MHPRRVHLATSSPSIWARSRRDGAFATCTWTNVSGFLPPPANSSMQPIQIPMLSATADGENMKNNTIGICLSLLVATFIMPGVAADSDSDSPVSEGDCNYNIASSCDGGSCQVNGPGSSCSGSCEINIASDCYHNGDCQVNIASTCGTKPIANYTKLF